MRILIIFSSSQLGGAERSLTRMAAVANADQPGTFDVATLDGWGPWVDWARQLGFEPAVLGGHGTLSIGGFGLAVLPRIIGLLRRERYSAIYVIGLRASVLLRLLKPFVGAPPLVHGIRWNPNSTSRLDKALRITERLLGGLVDFYVTNSNIAAKTLVDTAGIRSAKVATIFNGIDRVPAAGQDGGEKTTDLLTIANYAPRKGLLEYIERVILPLSLKRPYLRVMLVGRDDMHGAVQDKVKELNLTGNVTCTGFQPDVSPLLARARIFVLPSLWNEGCPTSLLEAMSWRLPVVAFSIDGIPELVDTGNDGTLLPYSDYAAMSSAIDSLLTSESERVRLGDNGHRKVASRFQLLHTARRHIEVFSDLIAKRPKTHV